MALLFFVYFDILCVCVRVRVCKVFMPVWQEMSFVTLAQDNSGQEVLSGVLHSGTVKSLCSSRPLNSIGCFRFWKFISHRAWRVNNSVSAIMLLMLRNG